MSKAQAFGNKAKTLLKQSQQARAVDFNYDLYSTFDVLDGTHPWREAMPEGCLLYPVRRLNYGKISYFNFDLAIEMGLISAEHPKKMNKTLESKLLETFSIRIINEYDQKNNVIYPKSTFKPNKYMATRYLQLQHPDKTGRTSGDGRCIWNGVVNYKNQIWDVSSRGTGVTALAPGSIEAGKPLRSGSDEFGYGCGMAEIDELFGAAIMAEIFHCNSIQTERVLAIIDLGNGIGIGVRAALNLIRPAHLFMYLKQERLDELKRATDYFINRQFHNNRWSFSVKHSRRYDLLLTEITESFAHFAATLDRNYIFAWLDWDGDNVLADAGIIDYGSVRQFGLRHDQYRYDDTDRFSTNLNEQRQKARLTVQVFCQMIDYIKTGIRRPLREFKKHKTLAEFDSHFRYYLHDRFLYQLGFDRDHREFLLSKHRIAVSELFANFSYLERIKTYRKMMKVADGVNRPAIFNMRKVAREFPMFLRDHVTNFKNSLIDTKDFFHMMLADTAPRKKSKMTPRMQTRILRFQSLYKDLLLKASSKNHLPNLLESLCRRSFIINRADRLTGNALINVVDEIVTARKNGYQSKQIQEAMDELIRSQCLDPDVAEKIEQSPLHIQRRSQLLLMNFLTHIDGCKEDI